MKLNNQEVANSKRRFNMQNRLFSNELKEFKAKVEEHENLLNKCTLDAAKDPKIVEAVRNSFVGSCIACARLLIKAEDYKEADKYIARANKQGVSDSYKALITNLKDIIDLSDDSYTQPKRK